MINQFLNVKTKVIEENKIWGSTRFFLKRVNLNIKRGHIHGPSQAIPVANKEPKSWPKVAPAPINPNSLEPDWTQDGIKARMTTVAKIHLQHGMTLTSLSMTSATLAHVEDIVIRFNRATWNEQKITFKIFFVFVSWLLWVQICNNQFSKFVFIYELRLK